MVISDSHHFLFVHIPKTAGKSISAALAPEGNRRHPLCVKSKHETVESFVERHGSDVFGRYYSFCVVRHPLDRLLSHFSYLKTNVHSFPEMSNVHVIDAYVEAIERNDPVIIRKKERVLPQSSYIRLGTKLVAVSEVLRFEDLNETFPDLCRRLRLSARALPLLNKSIRCQQPISKHVKEFTESYYEADFRLFNY